MGGDNLFDEEDYLLYGERGFCKQHGRPLSNHPTGLNGPRRRSQHFLYVLTSIWYPIIHCLPYVDYAGLYNHRDNGSGKPLLYFIHGALVFLFLDSLLSSQVVVNGRNLMQRHALLFK